jgi:hypothetical protein
LSDTITELLPAHQLGSDSLEPTTLTTVDADLLARRQRAVNQFRQLIVAALEYLNVQPIESPLPPLQQVSILESKKREIVAKKFDAIPDDIRPTLKRVAEYLLLHGKSDSVAMANDTELGKSKAILDAIELGHKCGLLRWVFEIHGRHLIVVNPSLQDALTAYLWGE